MRNDMKCILLTKEEIARLPKGDRLVRLLGRFLR